MFEYYSFIENKHNDICLLEFIYLNAVHLLGLYYIISSTTYSPLQKKKKEKKKNW